MVLSVEQRTFLQVHRHFLITLYLRCYALLIQGVVFIADLTASNMVAGDVLKATREPAFSVTLRRPDKPAHIVLNEDPTRV
jgi:hypothetical protein